MQKQTGRPKSSIDLLARLKGVRRGGKGRTAKCPAYEDRQNSLCCTLLESRQMAISACSTIPRRRFISVRSFLRALGLLTRRPKTLGVPYVTEKTHHYHDRAAFAATVIKQIVETAPRRELQQAIEDYLRDEFSDAERQTIADREPTDA